MDWGGGCDVLVRVGIPGKGMICAALREGAVYQACVGLTEETGSVRGLLGMAGKIEYDLINLGRG